MRVALILLVTCAFALAGCGDRGDGETAALEESIGRAIDQRLAEEAPLTELRAVDCTDAGARCAVDLDVQQGVVRMVFAVALGDDRCWAARPVRVELVDGAPGIEPLERELAGEELRGCLA